MSRSQTSKRGGLGTRLGSHQYVCRNKTSMEYLVRVQVRHATTHILHLISKYHSTITVNTSPLRSSDHTHNSQSGVPVQRSFLHVQYNVQASSGHVLCEDGTCFLLAVNGRTKKLHHTGTLELTSICGKGGRQRIEINRCKTEDRKRED